MAVNVRVIAQLRAQGRDAIPGRTEEWLAAHRSASRNPFPRGQPQPFDQGMRPHPYQTRSADLDLADPFQAGAQAYAVVVEMGLDTEEVPSLLRDRDRG